MSDYLDSTRGWLPPILDANAPGQYQPQTMANTGTTESTNSRAFSKDRLYMLTVGSAAVRVGFTRLAAQAGTFVPPTGGMILPANSTYHFRAFDSGTYGCLYVVVEAADGAAAYQVTVQQRES